MGDLGKLLVVLVDHLLYGGFEGGLFLVDEKELGLEGGAGLCGIGELLLKGREGLLEL